MEVKRDIVSKIIVLLMKAILVVVAYLFLFGCDTAPQYSLCCHRRVVSIVNSEVPRLVLLQNNSGHTKLFFNNTLLIGDIIDVCLSVNIK